MQDLTHDAKTGVKAYLVPSSMSEGGEIHFDTGRIQMTAPGSQPISAPAAQWPGQNPEVLPLPDLSLPDREIPVSYPGDNPRPAVAGPVNAGNGRFGLTPAGSLWKKAPQ
jgi:hypothetical protein